MLLLGSFVDQENIRETLLRAYVSSRGMAPPPLSRMDEHVNPPPTKKNQGLLGIQGLIIRDMFWCDKANWQKIGYLLVRTAFFISETPLVICGAEFSIPYEGHFQAFLQIVNHLGPSCVVVIGTPVPI